MTTPLMHMESVGRRYDGNMVLDHIGMSIHAGEIIALVGPNGAGKSTLFRIMSLLENPDAGQMHMLGQACGRLTGKQRLALRRQTASVMQAPLLFAGTVRENVQLGLKLRRMPSEIRRQRADIWLEKLQITHLTNRDIRTLSGGEQQRVSIARALAIQPQVLFLDEPFAALDEPTRKALTGDLRVILQDSGITTVFITHDRLEAIAMATHVAVLLGGTMRQKGSVDDVFTHPVDSDVAEFLGYGNVVRGIVTSSKDGMVCIKLPNDGHVAASGSAETGKTATVLIHPEDIVLMTGEPTGLNTSARNIIHGTVTDLVSLGTTVRVVIDSGFTLTSVITRHALEELSLQPGARVAALFKATATKFYT